MESKQQSKSRKIVLRTLSVLVIALLVIAMPDIAALTNINEDAYVVQAAAKKQKVTFKANGGQYSWNGKKYPKTVSKRVTKGKKLGKMPEATRTGYIFTGYYTKKSGGTRYKKASKVKKNVTLYARWAKRYPTITFDPNGGQLQYSWHKQQSVTYNGKYGDLPVPERFDYTFLGWYTKRTGGSRITENSTVKVLKDTKLYARWRVNSSTYLADMPKYSWSGDKNAWNNVRRTGQAYTDQHGSYHYHGYVGSNRVDRVYNLNPSTMIYALGGQYRTFTGIVGLQGYYASDVDSGKSATVKIYGDGRLLWTSPKMAPGSANVNFKINVRGVRHLTFERNGILSGGTSYDNMALGVMDAKLSR